MGGRVSPERTGGDNVGWTMGEGVTGMRISNKTKRGLKRNRGLSDTINE